MQGSQTRGPWAACGPPDASVRPANNSKNDKSIKFDQILLILRAFLVNCGPQKLFSYKLRPVEHSFSRMWPSDQFEFETPGLVSLYCNYIIHKWNYCNNAEHTNTSGCHMQPVGCVSETPVLSRLRRLKAELKMSGTKSFFFVQNLKS